MHDRPSTRRASWRSVGAIGPFQNAFFDTLANLRLIDEFTIELVRDYGWTWDIDNFHYTPVHMLMAMLVRSWVSIDQFGK